MQIKQIYKISEFSERICISTTTLRRWDAIGKLVPEYKTDRGDRYYTEAQALEYLCKLEGHSKGRVVYNDEFSTT